MCLVDSRKAPPSAQSTATVFRGFPPAPPLPPGHPTAGAGAYSHGFPPPAHPYAGYSPPFPGGYGAPPPPVPPVYGTSSYPGSPYAQPPHATVVCGPFPVRRTLAPCTTSAAFVACAARTERVDACIPQNPLSSAPAPTAEQPRFGRVRQQPPPLRGGLARVPASTRLRVVITCLLWRCVINVYNYVPGARWCVRMQQTPPLVSSALEYARVVRASTCPDSRGEQSKKLLVCTYEVCWTETETDRDRVRQRQRQRPRHSEGKLPDTQTEREIDR